MTNFWDFALQTNERTNGQKDRTLQQARVSNKLNVGTFLWADSL